MSTIEITNEQLDAALLDALHKPVNTDFERFEQVLCVATLVSWYQHKEAFYPPMNAVDSDVFHQCCAEARKAGLME